MELEGRIAALEDEMKILKNEIQSTLVDIQEQILTHYYPALRAEGSSLSEEIMESLESVSSEEETMAPRDAPTSLEGQPPSRPEEKMASPSFTELAGWVTDTVERIGEERTRETIEMYAKGEYITLEVKDTLFQFISLSNEENPPEKVEMKEVLDVMLELDKLLGLRP